eukprot:1127167_1
MLVHHLHTHAPFSVYFPTNDPRFAHVGAPFVHSAPRHGNVTSGASFEPFAHAESIKTYSNDPRFAPFAHATFEAHDHALSFAHVGAPFAHTANEPRFAHVGAPFVHSAPRHGNVTSGASFEPFAYAASIKTHSLNHSHTQNPSKLIQTIQDLHHSHTQHSKLMIMRYLHSKLMRYLLLMLVRHSHTLHPKLMRYLLPHLRMHHLVYMFQQTIQHLYTHHSLPMLMCHSYTLHPLKLITLCPCWCAIRTRMHHLVYISQQTIQHSYTLHTDMECNIWCII